jgi:hypothetical protein
VIIVVGRPALDDAGELAGIACGVALAAVAEGATCEVVGSVGDDPDGDAVVVALGRAGVGHAALIRDPAGATPRIGEAHGPPPRLDAGDVDLGLHYHVECRVLVVAEELDPDGMAVAVDGAAYHGATLIVLVAAGLPGPAGLPAEATVLELPGEDEGAFAALVGHYAALLDAGRPADDAWHQALAGSGWESAGE